MRPYRSSRISLTLLALGTLLAWTGGPLLAQEEDEPAEKPARKAKPEVTLKAGDKAPAIEVEKWIKGEPVKKFEPDKVYVVEFWATWCGPCIQSMPHLSAVQKEYKDKGVTVIGTDVSEDVGGREYTPETLTKVEDFVKQQGDRMSYTVAYDGKTKAMDKNYMRAAGQGGIPCAFIVDKKGTVAWIGHPMWLDVTLAPVIKGDYEPKALTAAVEKAEKALDAVMGKLRTDPDEFATDWAAFEKEYPQVAKGLAEMKISLLLQSGANEQALAAWESFAKDNPQRAAGLKDLQFRVLLAAGKYDQATKVAAQLVDEAIAKKDAPTLNEIAWTIVDPEGKVKNKDLDLALKAATKADEFSDHKDAAIIDTLARVYFDTGDINKAIELQTKAIELAPAQMKEQLQDSLDEYKEAKSKGA